MNFTELNDRQKAHLTSEDIRTHYLPFILMDRGIEPLGPEPIAKPLPPLVERPTKTYHVVEVSSKRWYTTSIAFEKMEDALAFQGLNPLVIYNDEVYSAEEGKGPAISTKVLADHTVPPTGKETAEKRKKIREENESERKEWIKQKEGIEAVLEELVAEADAARYRRYKAEETNRIAAEYLELCKGDTEVAKSFLLKVRTQEQIDDAREFFLLEEEIAQCR